MKQVRMLLYKILYQTDGRCWADLSREIFCTLRVRAPGASQPSTCTETATDFSLPWFVKLSYAGGELFWMDQ